MRIAQCRLRNALIEGFKCNTPGIPLMPRPHRWKVVRHQDLALKRFSCIGSRNASGYFAVFGGKRILQTVY